MEVVSRDQTPRPALSWDGVVSGAGLEDMNERPRIRYDYGVINQDLRIRWARRRICPVRSFSWSSCKDVVCRDVYEEDSPRDGGFNQRSTRVYVQFSGCFWVFGARVREAVGSTVDDDFRVDFIKHPGDLVLIQNVQLHHIWSSDAMQTSADRLPAI